MASVLSEIIGALLEKQERAMLKAASRLDARRKAKANLEGGAGSRLTDKEIEESLKRLQEEKRVLRPLGRRVFKFLGLGEKGYNPITINRNYFVLIWSAFIVLVIASTGVAVFISLENPKPSVIETIYFIVVSMATVNGLLLA